MVDAPQSFLTALSDPSAPPLLLDGGMGTHLETLGADVTGALWSAQILRDEPALVRRAHDDFFRAGASAATSCSYQVTADGLAAAGLDPEEAPSLLRASVRIAREAADAAEAADPAGGPRWVLASVGPYGAGPGAGSEYDGAYGIDEQGLAAWHHDRLAILDQAGADAVLIETVPSLAEVRALAAEVSRLRTPVMLSLTVADGRLRDGSDLLEATGILDGAEGIVGIGVNCCSAPDAARALEAIGQGTDKPLLAYPNSGEGWDAQARAWTDAPAQTSIVETVPRLTAAGARMIGGCCRVGPTEIAEIGRTLREG